MEQIVKTYQRKGNAERAAKLATEQTKIEHRVAGTGPWTIEAVTERPAKRSIILDGYRAVYGDKEHCGDELAVKFTTFRRADGSLDIEAVYSLGAANGINVAARWGHLNHGQQRMNLGNVLRGMMNRGEEVKLEVAGR